MAMSSQKFDDNAYIDLFELIFTFIYCAEALAKILSLGFGNYFKNPWNKFDFVLIIIIIMENFFLR